MGTTVFEPVDLLEKVKWLGRVLEHPDLSPEARAIAAAMFHRHNTKTGRCDPGMADLARLAGCCRRKAQMARDELVAAGFLEAIQRKVGDADRPRYLSSAYRLLGVAARKVAAAVTGRAPGAADALGGGACSARQEPMNLEPSKTDLKDGEKTASAAPPSPVLERLKQALRRTREGAALADQWLARVVAVPDGADGLQLLAPSRVVVSWLDRESDLLAKAARLAGVSVTGVGVLA